jgi:septal ring-binding cell division protein DamX
MSKRLKRLSEDTQTGRLTWAHETEAYRRPHETAGGYRSLQETPGVQELTGAQETTGDYRSTGAQETTGAYREHRGDRKEKDRLADRPQTDHRLADRPRQTQTAADRPRTGRQTAADRPQPPYHYTLQKSTGVQGAYRSAGSLQ